MLSVILISMLIILLSTVRVIRHLICGNSYNWLLNLNLIYETLWTGAGSGLLILMLKKTQLVLLYQSNNTTAIDMKMDGSFLLETDFLGLTFSSKLDWGSYIISIAKNGSKKIGALICFMKFLLRLLCISINLPYAHA